MASSEEYVPGERVRIEQEEEPATHRLCPTIVYKKKPSRRCVDTSVVRRSVVTPLYGAGIRARALYNIR